MSKFISLNLVIECEGTILGCASCDYPDPGADYVLCNKCKDGFYLLKNETYLTDKFNTYFTFCVSDCSQAHQAFVNNPATGDCINCGTNSMSCNLRYGTERCEGEEPMLSPIVSLDTG